MKVFGGYKMEFFKKEGFILFFLNLTLVWFFVLGIEKIKNKFLEVQKQPPGGVL